MNNPTILWSQLPFLLFIAGFFVAVFMLSRLKKLYLMGILYIPLGLGIALASILFVHNIWEASAGVAIGIACAAVGLFMLMKKPLKTITREKQ